MSKRSITFVFMLLFFNLVALPLWANKTWKNRFIIRAGVSGISNYSSAFDNEVQPEMTLKPFSMGSSVQVGFASHQTDLKEFRHYIEIGNINYSAELKYLGSFKANLLLLSISPFQYHVKLNPGKVRVVALEGGITLGGIMEGRYRYDFLGNKRSTDHNPEEEEINALSLNLGVNMEGKLFNKSTEIGLKCRISSIPLIFETDYNFLSTEFFYGIKF